MRTLRTVAALLTLLVSGSSYAAGLPAAPPWELNDLEGNAHQLEEWRGKWTLLKMARIDCELCEDQWKELGKTSEEIRKLGLAVIEIFINPAESRSDVKKYVSKQKYPLQPVILYDWKGRVWKDYNVKMFPHMVLVDPHGGMAWQGGMTKAGDLAKLLADNASPKKP